MKTISQIARECNLCYETVKSVVRKEGIVSVVTDQRINYYDVHQEAYIISVLSQIKNLKREEFETYPSKMNRADFKDTWHEDKFIKHKKTRYGK